MTTSTDAVCIARKHTVAARSLPAARAAVISSIVIAAILVRQSCAAADTCTERNTNGTTDHLLLLQVLSLQWQLRSSVNIKVVAAISSTREEVIKQVCS
jgi:hypothetical protein